MSKIHTQWHSGGQGEGRKRLARQQRQEQMAAWVGVLEENTRLIPLGHWQFTKVDADDFAWLDQWNWYLNNYGYVCRQEKGHPVQMHRVLLNTPKGMYSDHINRDPLDNRRRNLRIATATQNGANKLRGRPQKTSDYKGVSWCKDRRGWKLWYACGKGEHGKTKNLGRFYTEIEAARAYNEHAKKVFGEFALLNPV